MYAHTPTPILLARRSRVCVQDERETGQAIDRMGALRKSVNCMTGTFLPWASARETIGLCYLL